MRTRAWRRLDSSVELQEKPRSRLWSLPRLNVSVETLDLETGGQEEREKARNKSWDSVSGVGEAGEQRRSRRD